MELVKVGRVKKHCDKLNPAAVCPVSFVSLIVSPWIASISLLVSKTQASILALTAPASEDAGVLAGFAGGGEAVATATGCWVVLEAQPAIITSESKTIVCLRRIGMFLSKMADSVSIAETEFLHGDISNGKRE
jgi:hypothetical protein